MFSHPSLGDLKQYSVPRMMEEPLECAPTSPQTEAGIVPYGFGFEFESCLQARLQAELDLQAARLHRYSRFGMDADNARQPTPEDLQQAYRTLIESELADVHTPSPSPSPGNLSQASTSRLLKHHQIKRVTGSTPTKQHGRQGSRMQRRRNKIVPRENKKEPTKRSVRRVVQKRPSTHSMETRSRKSAKVG